MRPETKLNEKIKLFVKLIKLYFETHVFTLLNTHRSTIGVDKIY